MIYKSKVINITVISSQAQSTTLPPLREGSKLAKVDLNAPFSGEVKRYASPGSGVLVAAPRRGGILVRRKVHREERVVLHEPPASRRPVEDKRKPDGAGAGEDRSAPPPGGAASLFAGRCIGKSA